MARRFAFAFVTLSLSTLLWACAGGGISITIPPAETPVLISTGIQVTGTGGATTTAGSLTAYCNDYTAAPSGPNGQYGRGLYVTVDMPTLNSPEVSFAGTTGDYWGAWTGPTEQALSQGPKPITNQQIQSLTGRYVGYFIHDDQLVSNDYHVTIGILLGRGVPERGTLDIRSVNDGPQNTGLQARSNPLSIEVTAPVRLTASISETSVNESDPVVVSWQSVNADQIALTGPGLGSGGTLPLSGNQNVTAQCVGDRDSTQSSYVVKALRTGCSTPRLAQQNLPLTVNSLRKIVQFEGLPHHPAENSNFQLRWNAPGATGIALSGPNFSHNSGQSQGQVSVTAPAIPQNSCLRTQNQQYQINANWGGSCGPRTDTTLVTVNAVVATFEFFESGGSNCLSSNRCLAQGRTADEARMCATCSIQVGCTWQLAN